ncbi:MAG: TIGR00266 family protein [Planctomycetota bacterium]|nr:TIGR00266 family protein [Planctomycetota bacterium]
MQHEIVYRPSYSLAVIKLNQGESIIAESGAMVSMSETITLETKAQGGIFSSLKRAVLGGESFFQNTFKAERGPGEIMLAPDLPGDISTRELKGQPIFIQSGAFLACSPAVTLDTAWGGAKTFFSREGLFLLKAGGTGTVFMSSYGAIHEITLGQGQKYIVDTGHMVAFDEGVKYAVRTAGGLKSTLFSGEGLVCELTGPGKIMIQSRSEDAFLSWLLPKIPRKS